VIVGSFTECPNDRCHFFQGDFFFLFISLFAPKARGTGENR
jgi:hypothetical protein